MVGPGAHVGDVRFEACDAGAAPAAGLIAAMVEEMRPLYGPIDGAGTPSASPADFAPPAGTYLVGRAGGDVVAGGGVKRIGEGIGEVKRMYVVPAWRGRGIGAQLLAALEDAAAGLGLATVRLDTGAHQAVAKGLYERRGYRPIPDYNGNPKASYWAQKRLADDARAGGR